MNKKLEMGITLIALIITIIVLLILAGVTITMLTGENGILNRAVSARETTAQKTAEEQVKLAIMGSYNASGKIDLAELKENLNKIDGITNITEDITDTSFPLSVTVNGQEVELNKSGDTITAVATEGTTIPSTPEDSATYTAYNIGDEVTVGGESFYVLEASDENTETVTLLSKYNLNTAGTAQSNVGIDETACAFSSINYWSDDFTSSPFDLNDLGKESTGDAIAIAKTYAANKGATSGRLLTSNEAITLMHSYGDMIFGKESFNGFLIYWLGDAFDTVALYIVNSPFKDVTGSYYEGYQDYVGVRPVITITKSLVS